MESLKFIGISICITTVITSIFTMLLPDGKLDNVIKFAITLFFLTSIVTPFIDSDLNLDFKSLTQEISLETNKTLEKELSNTFIQIAKSYIEEDINDNLIKNNIPIKKVSISINILSDSSIYIEKVKIYITSKEEDNTEKINEIVLNEINIIPEIIIID